VLAALADPTREASCAAVEGESLSGEIASGCREPTAVSNICVCWKRQAGYCAKRGHAQPVCRAAGGAGRAARRPGQAVGAGVMRYALGGQQPQGRSQMSAVREARWLQSSRASWSGSPRTAFELFSGLSRGAAEDPFCAGVDALRVDIEPRVGGQVLERRETVSQAGWGTCCCGIRAPLCDDLAPGGDPARRPAGGLVRRRGLLLPRRCGSLRLGSAGPAEEVRETTTRWVSVLRRVLIG